MVSYEELSQVFDMDNPLTLEYFELCNRDTDEPKYFEKHHILPRCMFPLHARKAWNLVKLTYQGHYRVHEILPLICLQKRHRYQMARAWNTMHRIDGKVVDDVIYAELKKLANASAMRGESHPNFGKAPYNKGLPASDEMKLKLSLAQSGERHRLFGKRHTPETLAKMSARKIGENHPMYGRKQSEDAKQRISEAHKGENNFFYGKKHSVETLERISILHCKPVGEVELALKHVGISLLGGYTAMTKHAILACSNGHEFEDKPYSVIHRAKPCRYCEKGKHVTANT